jgi:hypothetical protein
MATRTISNTGGNYNATGTWVEGAVPNSSDDVVSTATSGQLTVNVTSAARSINLSNYTNTLTMNSNLTVSGASVTNTLGASMNFAGTAGTLIFTNAQTLVQNTTNRIPRLAFTGTAVRTLSTDMYCVNFQPTQLVSATLNGNNIYVSGNVGVGQSGFATNDGLIGTTKIIADGSGWVSFISNSCPVEINTTGTYSTFGIGMFLASPTGLTCSFTWTAGNVGQFAVTLYKNANFNAADNYLLNLNKKITAVYIENEAINGALAGRRLNINLLSPLNVDYFGCWSSARAFTTDNSTADIRIIGGGLSASELQLIPINRTTSSDATLTTNNIVFRGPDLKLNSDFTHNIGRIVAIGGGFPSRPLISSITASSVASINLASKITSQILDYNFQDINAVGEEIVAIGGTLSNTTNVTNTYPSGGGGGGGGGSFTFVN